MKKAALCLVTFWLVTGGIWFWHIYQTTHANPLDDITLPEYNGGDSFPGVGAEEEVEAVSERNVDDFEDENSPVLTAKDMKLTAEEEEYIKKWGFNLQGLRCSVRPSTGNLTCFVEDLHGRAYCPEYVTPAFLSLAPRQGSCQAEEAKQSFCTAKCQEGHEDVRWMAHHLVNCINPGDCPEQAPWVPIDQFKTEKWKPAPTHAPKSCTKRKVKPFPADFKDVTMGILTREIASDHRTITDALQSWADGGLLEGVGEVILWVNERDHSLDHVFEKYTKPPYNVKLMGSSSSLGIGRSYDYMIGNMTGKYFLFVEKDFVLVEPRMCWQEQLQTGVELLRDEKADVVRYRSRFNPGRPLWALKMFVGREQTVLDRQRDLLCYHYHWLENPMKMWDKPEYFTLLNEDPPFWGSDSKFCGWTNNPHMLTKELWVNDFRKYLSALADGVWGLEGFMNSNQEAWHNAHYIVGLGDGFLSHQDRNNFG